MNEMFNAFMPITLWCSAIILAVLLIRRLLAHKLAAKVFKLAWVCLAIRLVLPFSMALPSAPITVQVPDAVYVQSPAPVFNEQGNVVDTPLFDESITSPKALTAKMVFTIIKKALPAIWLIGALVFFTKEIVCYLFFMAHLRKSREAAQPPHHDLCGNVNIFVSPLISSPVLCGYLRPAIYLPCKIYQEQEKQSILQHEMTHYKQGDLWLQLLLLCATALSWFNPFVHIMRRKAICDIEIAVDEKMLSDATIEQRIEYGQMLFAEISSREGLLLAQYNSGKGTKERFKAILNTATKGKGRLFLCAILSVCVGVSLLVSCVPKPASDSVSSPQPAISAPPMSQPESDISMSQPQQTSSNTDKPPFALPLSTEYTSISRIVFDENNNLEYDIVAPKDTPVLAILDGEVVEAVTDPSEENWSRGNYVKIDHGNGFYTVYAHCTEIKAKKGDTVSIGDVIATVGSTGRSSGNHLCFTVIADDYKSFLAPILDIPLNDICYALTNYIYNRELSEDEINRWSNILTSTRNLIQ